MAKISQLLLITVIALAIGAKPIHAYEVPIPDRLDVNFSPTILESRNEQLCQSILHMAEDRFFSRDQAVDIRLHPNPSLVWPLSDQFEPVVKQVFEKYPKRLVALSSPTNGNTTTPNVVTWEVPHGWRGSQYFLSVFPSSVEMQAAVDAAVANGSYGLQGQAGVRVVDGIWSVPPIFFHQGRFYLLVGYGRGREAYAGQLQVTEVTKEGLGDVVCSIQLEPENLDSYIPASLSKLVFLLDQIVGRGGQCEGSSRPNARLRARYSSVAPTAVLRPWVKRSPYLNSLETVQLYLSEWSDQSLTFKIHYRELWSTLTDVRADLREYYQRAYGFEEEVAEEAATVISDWTLRSHFNFPNNNTNSGDLPKYSHFRWRQDADFGANQDIENNRRELRSMILENRPLDAIKQVIERLITSHSRENIELILPVAESLQNPEVLTLLIQAGGDVDQGNMFGKTPLMVAAHLNLSDAASTLIDAGADLNKKTWTTYECPVKIDIGDRTALFYATENASVGLIRLLLENGSDADAVDTRGWTALDYLKLSSLNESEKTAAAELIRSYMDR